MPIEIRKFIPVGSGVGEAASANGTSGPQIYLRGNVVLSTMVPGDVIGYLYISTGEDVDFSLVNDVGGAFAIDGNKLVVGPNGPIGYPNYGDYSLVIKTDTGVTQAVIVTVPAALPVIPPGTGFVVWTDGSYVQYNGAYVYAPLP